MEELELEVRESARYHSNKGVQSNSAAQDAQNQAEAPHGTHSDTVNSGEETGRMYALAVASGNDSGRVVVGSDMGDKRTAEMVAENHSGCHWFECTDPGEDARIGHSSSSLIPSVSGVHSYHIDPN